MDFKRQKIAILGVGVDDISEEAATSEILKLTKDKKGHHHVVTINPEFVMLARKDPKFLRILRHTDLALADGMGVVLAKLILGGREHSRITGVDLVKKLCNMAAKESIVVGFLGGFDGVAKEVAKRQVSKYPKLKVAIADPGNPAIGYDLKLKTKLDRIGGVDILFVAYGMGQQEFWIDRVKNRLPVGVFIGVGGAFDYLSTVKMRAPKVLQTVGFEWLWRLFMEPARFWRMRVLPIFLVLILKAWISKKLLQN